MTARVGMTLQDGGIVRISIDNPPGNALSPAVRQALWDALETAEADADLRVILLEAEGPEFSIGTDIADEGAAQRPPSLSDLCDRVEACAKPVVAVLQGDALGGGFELALAAHYRLALEGAYVGLPEVTLGMVPGAGGTQRLPRLAGGAAALDILLTGQPVPAAEAQAMGIIDRAARGAAGAAAIAYAGELLETGAGPRPTRDRRAGLRDAGGYMAAVQHHRGRLAGPDVPAPGRIVDCVEAALLLPFDAGLAYERAAAEDCAASAPAQALRHAALAERRAARIPERAQAAPRPVRHVGLVNAGSDLAVLALEAGLPVTLVAPDPGAVADGIGRLYEAGVAQGRLSDAQRNARLAGLTASADPAALAGVDLVIAAWPPDRAVTDRLAPGTVLALTGSTGDVETGYDPACVAGLYLPTGARLAEVLVGAESSARTVATLFEALGTLGMTAVRSMGVRVGPAVNAAMLRAAADMLAQGGSPYRIDAALRGFGFELGPYERLDRDGMVARAGALGQALEERGWTGRAAGRGFYRYDREAEPRAEDPKVLALLDVHQSESGRPQRSFTADEIVQRIMAAAANAGARLVAAGRVLRPSDIDAAMILGQGFPRWHGGPMMTADQTGLLTVKRTLDILSEEDPEFWAPAPLFADLIKNGRRFADMNGS